MSHYKIVASDLDGTLLNSSSELSNENLEAIKKLSSMGVEFVPSTGRSFSEIPDFIKNIDGIRYFIHSNGAVVYDKLTGERILSCIASGTVAEIMLVLKKYDAHVVYRENGNLYVDPDYQNDKAFKKYNVSREHENVILNYGIYLDDFEDAVSCARNIEVFAVFFKSQEDKLSCRAELLKIPDLNVVECFGFNLEIFHKDAGKGNALRKLAELLSVDYNDTIAIGDSDNDTSMLRDAGLGLATSNACEPLKNVSDRVICSNDEHVAEYVLNHYFEL